MFSNNSEKWVNFLNNFSNSNESECRFFKHYPLIPNNSYGEWTSKFLRESLYDFRLVPFEVNAVVALLGLTLSTFNVLVYTRKSMMNSVNVLLAALEFSNILFFLTVLPDVVTYIWPGDYFFQPPWKYFTRSVRYVDIASTTSSNLLAVCVGVWRCVAIGFSLKAKKWLTKKMAFRSISVIYLIGLAAPIPNALIVSEELCRKRIGLSDQYGGEVTINLTLYFYDNDRSDAQVRLLFVDHVVFVLLAGVPALLMALTTCYLIRHLCKSSRMFRRAHQSPSFVMTNQTNLSDELDPRERRDFKLTVMLLVILVVFISTYVPYVVCYARRLANFEEYQKDRKVFEEKSLCNSVTLDGFCQLFGNAVSFFIYYYMSEKFRDTFHELCPHLPRCHERPYRQNRGQSTRPSSFRLNLSTHL